MEKSLNELVAKLKDAAGASLRAVVLYGSAVTGEFHPKHSDLNVLCVLEPLDATALDKLNSTSAWWVRKGNPAPLVFSLEELSRFADVFAIEFLDIKANHRVLAGADVFDGLSVPMKLHRAQVERELHTNLIRLRQSYLARQRSRKALRQLMTASISTFATLFRHALLAVGEHPPELKRDVFAQLAAVLGFKSEPFHAVLDLREGKRAERDLDIEEIFRSYVEAVARVADEMDRRLSH